MSMEKSANKKVTGVRFILPAVPFFIVMIAAVLIPLLPVLPLPERMAHWFSAGKYAAAFLINNLILLPGFFALCRSCSKDATRRIFYRSMYLVYAFYCFLVGFVLSFGIGVSLFSLVLLMIYVGITLGAVIAAYLSMTAWCFCCKICDGDFVSRTGKLIAAGLISGAVLLTVTCKYL